jgi:hypothetical protein
MLAEKIKQRRRHCAQGGRVVREMHKVLPCWAMRGGVVFMEICVHTFSLCACTTDTQLNYYYFIMHASHPMSARAWCAMIRLRLFIGRRYIKRCGRARRGWKKLIAENDSLLASAILLFYWVVLGGGQPMGKSDYLALLLYVYMLLCCLLNATCLVFIGDSVVENVYAFWVWLIQDK